MVPVLDQVGWKAVGSLRVFSGITLLHLPPRSFELNPTERICRHLRGTRPSDWVYADCAHGFRVNSDAWNHLNPTAWATVTATEWLGRWD